MKRLVLICGVLLLFPRVVISDSVWAPVGKNVWEVAQKVEAVSDVWSRAEYKASGCDKCGCPCGDGVCTCENCQCPNCPSKVATVECPPTDSYGNRYYKENGKWKCQNRDGNTYEWNGNSWSNTTGVVGTANCNTGS